MAKSANDYMMTSLTRPHTEGCFGTSSPRLRTVMVGKSPVGSRGKGPVGRLDWRRSPEKLFLLILNKIFHHFSLVTLCRLCKTRLKRKR